MKGRKAAKTERKDKAQLVATSRGALARERDAHARTRRRLQAAREETQAKILECEEIKARYEAALRGAQVHAFSQDRDLRYTWIYNPREPDAAAIMLGRTDDELGSSLEQEAVIAAKLRVLASGEPADIEASFITPERRALFALHIEPVRSATGAVDGILCAAIDITERKQGEAHLRLLLRELTHRSKNLLAVIQAMARQTAKHGGTVQAFVERFGERVQALSRAHDLLVAESWRNVSLRDLVCSQLAYYIDREPDLIVIDGPEIKLRPEAAQSLGLALHELATNAAKHGAMSKTGGRVNISWQDIAKIGAPRDGFELVWRESGGPRVAAPKRRGFGSMAIEQNLTRALEADVSLDFASAGVICRILVPRSQIADRP